MARPAAVMPYTSKVPCCPVNSGNCAIKIRIASAFTKPVTTERDTKRISSPSFNTPNRICSNPVNKVAANKYSRPCSRTSVIISSAMAPVAAEIIAGRPPAKAVITAIQKEAYRPTLGSTPAIIEKAIASGIKASATTSADSTSPRTLENQVWRKEFNIEHPTRV